MIKLVRRTKSGKCALYPKKSPASGGISNHLEFYITSRKIYIVRRDVYVFCVLCCAVFLPGFVGSAGFLVVLVSGGCLPLVAGSITSIAPACIRPDRPTSYVRKMYTLRLSAGADRGVSCYDMSMTKRSVILIGGAPLTGKSTLAAELSRKLDMPWVSTDDIRKWMRALVRPEDYPYLFDGQDLDVESFYHRFKTAPEVFEKVKREGLDVQKGMTAMIDSFWWWDGFIIEGIAVTPLYVRQLQDAHLSLTVKPVFLIDQDRDNIRKRIDKRGLWGDAGTYPDYVKPIEVEWTVLLNGYYEQEAAKYGFIAHDITELATLKTSLIRST